jgi:hypothetical protein
MASKKFENSMIPYLETSSPKDRICFKYLDDYFIAETSNLTTLVTKIYPRKYLTISNNLQPSQ